MPPGAFRSGLVSSPGPLLPWILISDLFSLAPETMGYNSLIFRGFLLEYLNFYPSYLLSLARVLRGELDICLAPFSTSFSWDLGLSSLFLLTKGPAGSSIPQQRLSAWEDCRFPASRLVIRMQICSQGKCCGMSSHLLPWQSPVSGILAG